MPQSIRAIYVDDEADYGHFKSKLELLEDEGVAAVGVASVDEARKMLLAAPTAYDVIILDILMPTGSYSLNETNDGTTTGLCLLRQLRARGVVLPVIAVSVKARDTSPADLLASNGEVLQKPAEPVLIAEAARRVLRGAGK